MKRRKVLELLGLCGSAAALARAHLLTSPQRLGSVLDDGEAETATEQLRGEPPAHAVVRTERGGPRLFLNDREILPLFALSAGLLQTARAYKESGIDNLAPIVGLNSCWVGPHTYQWTEIDRYFAELLMINGKSFFLPRLHLNAPQWWKDAHPDEMIRYGIPFDKSKYKMGDRMGECGLNWNAMQDLYDVSYASDVWQRESGDLLRAFLRHMESSPLRSRMIGYQIAGGMTGEWHYIGSHFIPDYCAPMQQAIGPIPDAQARMNTTFGLLRDPPREKAVIDFYRRFHELEADMILSYARIVKEETKGRVLCGTFYTYLLENVMITEAGHLAPEKILNSPDIDYIPCPYTYQHTNIPGRERWESDIVDDAGNWLGRARGVGGDGGYRVLTESLKRHGKLYIAEMDASTYVEPKRSGEGGSGSDSLEGSLRIIRRDLGNMFATGVGGWLFDFGNLNPPFEAKRGWYDDPPIINEIRKFTEVARRRTDLDISSVAQIASVYDAQSFFATRHWKAEEPWQGYGISITDFFNHWFLNSQARTIHRIGAPVDFLYSFDFTESDTRRYRLILMPNLFSLSSHQIDSLRAQLKQSGATVVWYYAPGYVSDEKLDLHQMERLTGFTFTVSVKPGPLMIRAELGAGSDAITQRFGVSKGYFPRFNVADDQAVPLGYWTDTNLVAFASKEVDGWNSVYVGAAPLTAEILRWLCHKAGVPLWSSKPDVVRATRDAAMIMATSKGERTVTFPRPMREAHTDAAQVEMRLDMDFGDVRMFTA